MFYFYWPGKYIPEWLEVIRFKRAQVASNPYISHGGFGIVVRSRGYYQVKMIQGPFIRIKNCNDVDITGGSKGVYIHSNFISWIRAIFLSPKP